MKTLRVATFQRRPRFDDVAGTVERLAADLKWCDDHDVCLAVFPECYLQGYASDPQIFCRPAQSPGPGILRVTLFTFRSVH